MRATVPSPADIRRTAAGAAAASERGRAAPPPDAISRAAGRPARADEVRRMRGTR